MAAISQTIFSNAFSWMKMYEFRLRFRWSLFVRVQLTIFQYCFQIMAWRLPCDKPLSEPMMVDLLAHVCATRPSRISHFDTKVQPDQRGETHKLVHQSLHAYKQPLLFAQTSLWKSADNCHWNASMHVYKFIQLSMYRQLLIQTATGSNEVVALLLHLPSPGLLVSKRLLWLGIL